MKAKLDEVNRLCNKDGVYTNDRGQKTVSAWSKIKYFRQIFGEEYGIRFNIVEHTDRHVVMKCTISKKDPEFVLSEGYSKQYRDKPGYLDLAQTFALTRSLTYLGILDNDLTSKEEYESLGINLTKKSDNVFTMSANINVEEIKKDFKNAIHLPRLNYLRDAVYSNQIDTLLKKSLRDYRQVMDIYETRKIQLESEANFTSSETAHNN